MPSNPNINGPCRCGRCGNLLQVNGPSKTGKFIGHYYVHCHGCGWHYTFADGDAPNGAQKNPVPAKRIGQVCARNPCTKIAHGSCTNACCRLCCVIEGGCQLRDHALDSLSEAQQRKVLRIRASAQTQPNNVAAQEHSPDPFGEGGLSHAIATAGVNVLDHFRDLLEKDPVRLQAERVAAGIQAERERLAAERREEELEEQEERDFQAALAATRAELRAMSAEPRGLPEGVSITAGPSAIQPSKSSRAIPVTKVTSKNRPTITMQMNKDWMRQHEDRTKEISAYRGRSQIDQELTRRFRIIFWEKSGEDPLVFIVQECPHWPKWKISDSPTTVRRLGSILTLQFFDFAHPIWIECPLTYAHAVKTDGYIFLRSSAAVVCQNFDLQLSIAHQKAPHLRYSMTGERKTIKTVLKGKNKAHTFDDPSSSEGEVEIVTTTFKRRQPSPFKRSIKQERISPPTKRPRLTPLVISDLSVGSKANPMQIYESPSPSVQPSSPAMIPTQPISPIQSFLSPSPLPNFISAASPQPRSSSAMPGKVWPSNMYVEEMIHGFRRMDELRKAGAGNYEERFAEVFQQPAPRSNTYHDQVRKWNLASSELRASSLAAGKSSAGLWSVFSRAVRLKN